MKIEILTDNKDLSTACELYWELNEELEFVYKVAEISSLVGIDKNSLLKQIKTGCRAIEQSWKCENCDTQYVFSSRSNFIDSRKLIGKAVTFVCGKCQNAKDLEESEKRQHQKDIEQKAHEEAKKELRKNIKEAYDLENRTSLDVKDLSLTDLVYLFSLLRAGAYEDLSKIMPAVMFEQDLTPSKDFTSEILSYLHNKQLIYVHPNSDIDAFVEGNYQRFYTWHVSYAPPIVSSNLNDEKSLFHAILSRINGEWEEGWSFEAYQLWKRVALEESKEYLLFVLNEHHFEFSPGAKTIQYLEYALESFSTGQVFNTLWRSAKDAAAYYQRGNISKKQAANSAISSIQRTSERAIAEKWDIKSFRRNFKCPQTIISEVLYNSVLKLGEDGFNLSPNLEVIKNHNVE